MLENEEFDSAEVSVEPPADFEKSEQYSKTDDVVGSVNKLGLSGRQLTGSSVLLEQCRALTMHGSCIRSQR